MPKLTRQHLLMLIFLTLVWGSNWPVMKMGVNGYPPLTFRTWCLLFGWPVIGLVLWRMKVPFHVPRSQWRELFTLSFFNMFMWYGLVIVALASLSSGRAAILGYTMPIFSALWGVLFFHTPLRLRGWLGVASAALAAMLLLWHEVSVLSGHPLGVMLMLVAAASWGYGTQRMRHTTATVATLTLAFWMTGLTTVVMCVLSWVFEPYPWVMPSERVWWAIAYNAIGVFGFAQPAWLILARNLPPLASTLSVMFIPVLGAFSGAWWLGEQLHWQDVAAVLLIVLAIASVLWPAREAVRQT